MTRKEALMALSIQKEGEYLFSAGADPVENRGSAGDFSGLCVVRDYSSCSRGCQHSSHHSASALFFGCIHLTVSAAFLPARNAWSEL